MLFPIVALTSPYILFEGYVIEGSFICRGAPAGNRSVLYSLANSFEWQDAAPESILVSCRSCSWICCLHLLLFFLKKISAKCVQNLAVPMCIVTINIPAIFWGRLGQNPQFSTVLALDQAGSDFLQPGNSVSKVSVVLWGHGHGTKESPEKARMFFFQKTAVHHLLIYTLAKTVSQFVDM